PQRELEEGNQPSKGCSCCHTTNPPEIPKKEGPRWTSGLASLRCQGGQVLGSPAGASVAPPSPLLWHPDFAVVGRLNLSDVSPIQVMTDSLDPPPRLPAI